ncbi:MAG TPA: type II toxin-antitoxin system HicB family antitoxin [Alphaproteobacteria bacterium]
MRHYMGLIHKERTSDFGVSFPDFPGCISAGSTLDEAIKMGAEALAAHIGLLVEEGQPIPEPSSVERIMAEPENRDGVVVLIPGPDDVAKTVRVNITLPEDALRDIDAYAETHGYSRSGFIVHAAKKVIESAS